MNHIEKHWQMLATVANEIFNQGNFEEALSGYKDALYRAEVLNNHIPDCIRLKIPFIQVYIISCNNLAYIYEQLDDFEEAANILKRVIYYLLHLSGNKALNPDEIQSELKKATLAYSHFAEKNNIEKTEKKKVFRNVKEELLEKDLIRID